jgi:hypothetical protein
MVCGICQSSFVLSNISRSTAHLEFSDENGDEDGDALRIVLPQVYRAQPLDAPPAEEVMEVADIDLVCELIWARPCPHCGAYRLRAFRFRGQICFPGTRNACCSGGVVPYEILPDRLDALPDAVRNICASETFARDARRLNRALQIGVQLTGGAG